MRINLATRCSVFNLKNIILTDLLRDIKNARSLIELHIDETSKIKNRTRKQIDMLQMYEDSNPRGGYILIGSNLIQLNEINLTLMMDLMPEEVVNIDNKYVTDNSNRLLYFSKDDIPALLNIIRERGLRVEHTYTYNMEVLKNFSILDDEKFQLSLTKIDRMIGLLEKHVSEEEPTTFILPKNDLITQPVQYLLDRCVTINKMLYDDWSVNVECLHVTAVRTTLWCLNDNEKGPSQSSPVLDIEDKFLKQYYGHNNVNKQFILEIVMSGQYGYSKSIVNNRAMEIHEIRDIMHSLIDMIHGN